MSVLYKCITLHSFTMFLYLESFRVAISCFKASFQKTAGFQREILLPCKILMTHERTIINFSRGLYTWMTLSQYRFLS